MRWRRYFERSRRDEELSQEIAHYIAQETEDNVARGMSRDDARGRGDPQVRQSAGGSRGRLRDEQRRLARSRRSRTCDMGFVSCGCVPASPRRRSLSLALGIGANTAIFTLVDQILLRLLPVENPHELVQLRLDGVRPGGNWGDGRTRFPIRPISRFAIRTRSSPGVTGQRIEPRAWWTTQRELGRRWRWSRETTSTCWVSARISGAC